MAAAAPWVTLALLLAMLAMMGDKFPQAAGTLVELPSGGGTDAVRTELAALVLPGGSEGGTLAFFDDARYLLDDAASMAAFGRRLGERVAEEAADVLLLLADKRVPAGDVMRLVGVARECGVARVQIAERRGE